MGQKLEDLKLILKNDRRIWAALGFLGVVLFIFMMVNDSSRNRQTRRQVAVQQDKAELSTTDPYKDLILAFQSSIEKAETERKDTTEKLDRFMTNYQGDKQRYTGIFEQILEQLDQTKAELERLQAQGQIQPEPLPIQPVEPDLIPDEPVPWGFEPTVVEPEPTRAPEYIKAAVISPGDSVKVSLLTGVNAPVDGTPYPVVFKLDGAITGPDGSSVDIGEARLIAAAQGSESDGRVLFRLTDLAFRHQDGRRAVVKVDGWIVGEDGVRGMRGKLIDKLGRLIAATAGVSFAAALGERVATRNQNVQVSNNVAGLAFDSVDYDVAAASAFTDASNRLGKILADRYEKLVPVVEILSGRAVAAVFSQPTELFIIDDEETSGILAASLD